jgi:hypothetical protein
MQYADGRNIELGDRVVLLTGDHGVVVVCFDTQQFATGFEDWTSLTSGVLVKTDKGALARLTEPGDLSPEASNL